MKRLGWFVLRLAAGLLLAWVGVALVQSLVEVRLSFSDREVMLWCFGGSAVGALVFMRFRLVPVYVFGHELTHWLVAKAFRRRTSRFTVRFSSGSVRVERPNIWIVLGPYILPLYMLLFLGVYQAVRVCVSLPREVQLGCAAAIGALYAYHLVLTVVALLANQPDLKFNGPCFSLMFIVFFNLLFLYLGLTLAGGCPREGLLLVWDTLKAHAQAVRRLIWWNSLVLD